ncbi:zinc ion binding [Branchiostoma belcheri]|nr:zinc ion binding [Branchiostoma belcheri]
MDPVTADDSDCGTGCEIPANTQDTQTDLSHPDSTIEPVVLHEIQSQRRSYRAGLEGQTDISPGHVEDPLQTDISPGHMEDPLQTDISPGHVEDPLQTDISPGHMEDPLQTDISPGHVEDPLQTDISPGHMEDPLQTDISPGHVGDPLPDVHNASFEQYDQDNGPNFSPDNGEAHSPLQANVAIIYYTNGGKTEQNQTLYVDSPLGESEEPPKDIYDTEAHNAQSVAQHRLSADTCHRETPASVYQSGRDADDACMDRPDVGICETNSKAEDIDHSDIQTETVVKRLKDVENSSQNRTDSGEAMSDDEWIRPYAVAYDQFGHSRTHDEQGDVFPDVQPYAVAYDDDKEHYENQTSTGLAVGNGGDELRPNPNNGNALLPNPMYSGNVLHPNPMYSGNALHPNPMYSGNALHPNLMYVPNGAQPRTCGGLRNGRFITTGVTLAILMISVALIGIFVPGNSKQDSLRATTWPDLTFTGKTTDQSRHVDNTSPQPTSTEGKETDELEVKQTTIVFVRMGHEPGTFNGREGVVVSPSNEIFISDGLNKRVQVFSTKGVHLRHFPTITSESDCRSILPKDISIDGKGHLWVIGDCRSSPSGRIVRYTETGHHITTLHPSLPNNTFFGIAVDALRSHVVVTEAWFDYSVVKVLHFSGAVVREFRVQQGSDHVGAVTVGQNGNIFVTDHWSEVHVHVYSETGHYLFKFGDEEKLTEVTGICTDSSDNVLVADGVGGKVELFAKDGRYVRTAASGLFFADSVAVAPGGQLVVTNDFTDVEAMVGVAIVDTLAKLWFMYGSFSDDGDCVVLVPEPLMKKVPFSVLCILVSAWWVVPQSVSSADTVDKWRPWS